MVIFGDGILNLADGLEFTIFFVSVPWIVIFSDGIHNVA
jgi:hypothetical protein